MNKLFFLSVGLILTIIGTINIISYLNLLSIGYNFIEYVHFIISHIECLYTFIGIIIIIIILTISKRR